MKHNNSFLFLRGLTRNQYHWKERDSFEKILNAEVHFLDLPGFGVQSRRSSPKNISEITDFLKTTWDNNGYAEDSSKKRFIVGLSLGGVVAMDWVSRYPKDWDGFVMINSSVSDLSWPWERLLPGNYSSILKCYFSKNYYDVEKIIYEMTCYKKDKKDDLIQNWTNVRKEHPFRKTNALNQIKAASKYKSPKKIETKGMILVSTKDQLVSSKCSEAIAQKYKLPIFKNEIAGHDMSVDDKDWMLGQIKEFATDLL